MRFKAINITGNPKRRFVTPYDDVISQSKFKELYKDEHLTKKDDQGLMLYTSEDSYPEDVVIPETHPLFNYWMVSSLSNKFIESPYKGVDAARIGQTLKDMVIDKYITNFVDR